MLNKEAAIKKVRWILTEYILADDYPHQKPPEKIVDAVIGELFGYKAKSAEDCAECLLSNCGQWDTERECACLEYNDVEDVWGICPKPERPRGEV